SPEELAVWRITDPATHPLNPDRWAEDRQYARHDANEALAGFVRRRGAVTDLLRSLSPSDWDRVGIHARRGRLGLEDWAAGLVAHDANHLEQLERALQGQP